ncbi:sulfurtransferase/chromate resistance protein [Rhizobiaceae bacterium n13]|uniref:Sulfurtransferase/chromate resistance protein n=1 Tax=Ferirhizobium litorale TaxID=2927786 RepID=A0AAE3QE55_9HYPH|nr:sulfurtransferase/chromate resistance protein [Fererhizobium litorale]MDI7864784.1 sulfurtransferase/chromate resistance protein [Fererhizobium litorale]MDI7921696.1 sulfurtransferase/chromate resistance protein [Fererhizobium litorale]
MASYNSISCEKVYRLVGTAKCPMILDVRSDDDFAANPCLLPGAVRRDYRTVADWAPQHRGQAVVAVCAKGHKISEGVAAYLRLAGTAAEVLEGGIDAWRLAGYPLVPAAKLPGGRTTGGTVWVTRSRPKIDRIACPWLIRRFVDPAAVFLYVTPAEVEAVAVEFGGMPFDIEGAFWSHRGEDCTFDTMVKEFVLAIPALEHVARIVRGADTDRLDLAPEAAGLLAVSLGLSRGFADDLQQLEAGMVVYDGLYRWARDATQEKHDWVSHGQGTKRHE